MSRPQVALAARQALPRIAAALEAAGVRLEAVTTGVEQALRCPVAPNSTREERALVRIARPSALHRVEVGPLSDDALLTIVSLGVTDPSGERVTPLLPLLDQRLSPRVLAAYPFHGHPLMEVGDCLAVGFRVGVAQLHPWRAEERLYWDAHSAGLGTRLVDVRAHVEYRDNVLNRVALGFALVQHLRDHPDAAWAREELLALQRDAEVSAPLDAVLERLG